MTYTPPQVQTAAGTFTDDALQCRFIHRLLQTGDLGPVREAGVTEDWLSNFQCKGALFAINDYAENPKTRGQVPGMSYLAARIATVPAVPDTGESLEQLVEALKIGRYGHLLSTSVARAYTDISTNPALVHQQLMEELTSPELEAMRSQGRETSLHDLAPSLFQTYVKSMKDAGVTGVQTPFPTLTYSTKGWQRGAVYTYFAAVKSYKTWCGLMAGVTAFNNYEGNVLVVSGEMPAEQCAVRVLCLLNGWNFNEYRDRRIGLPQIGAMFKNDEKKRFHFFQPSGFDLQAIAQVRAKIQRLNLRGGVSLVIWDGHYRSASVQDWECIYQLVRRTQMLAAEPGLLQPPILMVTQEGSKKGKATHAVYEQESSLMVYLTKTAPGKVLLQTPAVREGPAVEIEVAVNLRYGMITEVGARIEDSADAMTGGLT